MRAEKAAEEARKAAEAANQQADANGSDTDKDNTQNGESSDGEKKKPAVFCRLFLQQYR